MKNMSKKDLAIIIFIFLFIDLIGFLFIINGSFTIVGALDELRGFVVEVKSTENILGILFLIFSLLIINFSFIIQLSQEKKKYLKTTLFLSLFSLLFIVLASISYIYFIQEVITEISINLSVKNLHITNSTLLGAFGIIYFLILVGLYSSVSNFKRSLLKNSKKISPN